MQQYDNVEIANLTLNGSSAHALVGGHWGDTGIQPGYNGLFIGDSRRVRLRALAMHHFGRAGIQVLNHLAKSVDDPARKGIVFENSRFDYNGRQGLSITGVNGLRATNCSFSHTGRVIVLAFGWPLYSNPGAGIDIEPEGGYAANVLLKRCHLVDNAGQALVSDLYGSGPPATKPIVLRDCLLRGTTNWSAWVRQTKFLFGSCRLYGAFVKGCALADYAMRFVGCTFEDRPYRGEPAYEQHLVYSSQKARAIRFTNCRFVSTRITCYWPCPLPLTPLAAFGCKAAPLQIDNAEPLLGSADQLAGVACSDTRFASGPHRAGAAPREVVLGRAEVPHSAVVVAQGSLQLLAPNCRHVLPAGLVPGRAGRVVVGAGSTLFLSEQSSKAPESYIGPGARLIIKNGGALELRPHTHVAIAG